MGEAMAAGEALALAVLVPFEREAAEPVDDAGDEHVSKRASSDGATAW
jgi:hypothetical protein